MSSISTAISALLPVARHQSQQRSTKTAAKITLSPSEIGPPAYGHRRDWMPRTLKDFGDGGAFPEIHVAQYPLDMGRKSRSGSTTTLALRTDESGQIDYGAIVRQGHAQSRLIHTSIDGLKPLDVKDDDPELRRPSQEEIAQTKERTQAALDKLLNAKMAAKDPTHVKSASSDPTYIKYTPQQPENGPGSPPAPVMHSPPRKVTEEEQKAWFIPPCISNWKNAKGYTIPLDKRLAADGRGLQEVTINDKFAKFSEALYVAAQHTREEIEKRQQLQRKLAEKEKEAKEDTLLELARRAREEKATLSTIPEPQRYSEDRESSVSAHNRDEDRDGYQERERARRERERDIHQQVRMKDRKSKGRAELADRDVSEKIALGVAASNVTRESLYDQRLFNRSQGIGSGFKDDEAYNLYDNPLFQGSAAASIYRPKKLDDDLYGGDVGEDMDRLLKQNRFVPDKTFQGVDAAATREGPVQFEKQQPQEDPFGIDQFLSEAKSAAPKRQLEQHSPSRDSKKSRGLQ